MPRFLLNSLLLACAAGQPVFLPAVLDTTTYPWTEKIVDFTISLLNNHTDGFFDDVLVEPNGTITPIEWALENSACDPKEATRAYWNLRTSRRPHALIGARCSGASVAIARMAGLDEVPQISPTSSSAKLSDTDEFPLFARLISAHEVKALVSLFRSFGWERISVLYTDTQYSQDLATTFQNMWNGPHTDASGSWEGVVPYSQSLLIQQDGTVDPDSIDRALQGAPTDDPSINSRIMLLIAHERHAFAVLEQAKRLEFQPDTIWVGTDGWTGHSPSGSSTLESFEGVIGLTPYRNRDSVYHDYLRRFTDWQRSRGLSPWSNLPNFAAENLVDSIVAAALAVSAVAAPDRLNGTLVFDALLNVEFNGISGKVAFRKNGDRQDPLFSIFNVQATGPNGTVGWVDVGVASTKIGETVSDQQVLCFPEAGCDLSAIPVDSYPIPEEPPEPPSAGITVGIPIILAVLVIVAWRYQRTRSKKRKLKETMTTLQKRMKIDDDLVNVDRLVEEARKRQADLIERRALLQDVPETWSSSMETLVDVPPDDEQYWMVLGQMRSTMRAVHISKLWRVQNMSLWTYYSFHKDRLSTHSIPHGERHVWHGTSSLDPSVIYNDQQDGFMMQFAAQGYWGRGIYFAEKASYSSSYARRAKEIMERDPGKGDEREMFLAKLLVGSEIFLNRDESPAKAAECSRLTVPPMNPSTGFKYNTVSGRTADCKVYVVYENGRAYPEYLVRYYEGARDPKRSPYETREEAFRHRAPPTDQLEATEQPTDQLDAAELGIVRAVWEFEDNHGWVPYDEGHQLQIESHYVSLETGVITAPSLFLTTDTWTYRVDLQRMIQTNMEHSARRERRIRRHQL